MQQWKVLQLGSNGWCGFLLLTTCYPYSLISTHYSLLATRNLLLTTRYLVLTTGYLMFTMYHSLLASRCIHG